MALKPCRECGQEVSTDAQACPHCGIPHPVKKEERRGIFSRKIELSRRQTVAVLAVGTAILGFLMLSGDEPPSRVTPVTALGVQSTTDLPAFETVAREDLSLGETRRLNIRVSIPEHYSQLAIERIASAVVQDITAEQDVNAISLMFFGPGTSTAGVWDGGMVEWAPSGRWSDAASVRAGAYRSFKYNVKYRQAEPTQPDGREALSASSTRGLLDVPLPQGALLLERTEPAPGRDPSESYAIEASAADIRSFFSREMPSSGWARSRTSSGGSLFFTRGDLMIGVLINQSGGSFMLMGS